MNDWKEQYREDLELLKFLGEEIMDTDIDFLEECPMFFESVHNSIMELTENLKDLRRELLDRKLKLNDIT